MATIHPDSLEGHPSRLLGWAAERARSVLERGGTPDEALKQTFIDALARTIREAMRAQAGDPAFQAMVLGHGHAHVRDYASLSAQAGQDRRQLQTAINAIAHPARRERMSPGALRNALARLHSAASAGSWGELDSILRDLLAMPGIGQDTPLAGSLARLRDGPALARLKRLEALSSHESVHRYQALREARGPRPGSATATEQGDASQKRGRAVEASAARAIGALARLLDEAEGGGERFRVVTSMRVPSSIPADPDRAKTEWDAVLLRRAVSADEAPVWDICLLVEAKASVEAATTDLPRLLRGIGLLTHAEEDVVYSFQAREGRVRLRGASLRALATDEAGLARTVLYCSDAPVETPPRLLGAASRMQFLSARPSLEFAAGLADRREADPRLLEPVWCDLLHSPRWRAVLNQYRTLCQARALMVHVDDLAAAIDGAAGDYRAGSIPG